MLAANGPALDVGPERKPVKRGLAASGCYATAFSSSSERCIKDEIIQELGRSIQLLGGKSDLLCTVWSIGDTIEDEEALELLRVVNDSMPAVSSDPIPLSPPPKGS